MRKMMLTLTAAGALAIPVGMAVAQDDTPEPNDPVPTSTVPEPERDRDRVHADDRITGAPDREVGQHHGECDGDCDGPELSERNRAEGDQGEGKGPAECGAGSMVRERNQVRVEERPDDPVMLREREQVRTEDGADEATRRRSEERTDDTEQTTAENGAEFQFRNGPDDGRNG